MNKILLTFAGCAALLVLSACDTTSAIVPYTASTPNMLALQTKMRPIGGRLRVGDFAMASGVEKPGCRLVGQMDVTSGRPIEEYVKNALQTEIFTAQLYDVDGSVVISGQVDEVKVNTFGTGSWTLGLKVTSNRDPTGYHVETVKRFGTSYIAEAACRNASNAFAPAVQDLLGQVFSNPGFDKLAGRQ